MARRVDYFRRLCTQLGPNVASLLEARDGWPGTMEVQTDSGPRRLAVHIGLVNRLYTNQRPNDYRVLPPSNNPVQDLDGFLTLALGWWPGPSAVVVACDPERWRGDARSSQMFKLSMLQEAQANGWATYRSTDGDIFHAFRPFLLPAYVEAVARGLDPTTLDLSGAVATAWTSSGDSASTRQRARQACTRLVRDAAFRRDVVAAYGRRCAVCGLNFDLVQAAHVYPAAATDSVDEVWNGLCLCPNHHQAFDAGLLWIDPVTGEIRLHPRISKTAQTAGDRAIADTTPAAIRQPTAVTARPRAEMFRQRYAHPAYFDRYGWVV